MQQLVQPFFYNSFSIATGDPDHWEPEKFSVICRQFL